MVAGGNRVAALRFVQRIEKSKSKKFLEWMYRDLVVMDRLAMATVQCIDEAIDRLEKGE